MCRFLVYKGSDEILLSKLILDPTHSILKQSFDSRLRLDTRRGQNNADGFGIGFYTDRKLGPAPCVFTSTTPAWNCTNLTRIASKTASHLVFAHVRATTEGSLSEDNCHPFYHGSLMWMHNGGVGGWRYIKRRLSERLADRWYLGVQGGTDSEWAFALFLDTLERMGINPSVADEENGFGPTVLREALLRTIEIINELTDQIPESVVQSENVDTTSLLNFAVTDGHSVICTRYISSSTDEAASLYYSSGTQWDTRTSAVSDREYLMERHEKAADVVLVASEPLTFERENWVNVATNSILTISKQSVMVHPIIDQYYDGNPEHPRSSTYVQSKGLVSNEKAAAPHDPFVTTVSIHGSPKGNRLSGCKPSIVASRCVNPPTHTGIWNPKRPNAAMAPAVITVPMMPTASPPPRTPPAQTGDTSPSQAKQPPSERNISRKRAALPPFADGIPDASPDSEAAMSPALFDEDSPRREFGHPRKISRFFPELLQEFAPEN